MTGTRMEEASNSRILWLRRVCSPTAAAAAAAASSLSGSAEDDVDVDVGCGRDGAV